MPKQTEVLSIQNISRVEVSKGPVVIVFFKDGPSLMLSAVVLEFFDYARALHKLKGDPILHTVVKP